MTALASEGVKKGSNPKWKTGASLGQLSVPETHKGRWCNNDDANINKKMQEGWEFVNKTNFPQAMHTKKHGQKDVKDRESLGTTVEYRELVGMMLPIEDIHGTGQCVREREAYHEELNTKNMKARVRGENQRGLLGQYEAAANIKGKLQIIE